MSVTGWPKPSVWEKLVGRSKDFFIQYPGQESPSYFRVSSLTSHHTDPHSHQDPFDFVIDQGRVAPFSHHPCQLPPNSLFRASNLSSSPRDFRRCAWAGQVLRPAGPQPVRPVLAHAGMGPRPAHHRTGGAPVPVLPGKHAEMPYSLPCQQGMHCQKAGFKMVGKEVEFWIGG